MTTFSSEGAFDGGFLLFAVESLEPEMLQRLPGSKRRMSGLFGIAQTFDKMLPVWETPG